MKKSVIAAVFCGYVNVITKDGWKPLTCNFRKHTEHR